MHKSTSFSHKPVMLGASITTLLPERGGIFVDCTLGGGGHSEAILERLPDGSLLIGIDRDLDAINAATTRLSKYGDKFKAVHDNFFNIKEVLKSNSIEKVDGIIADLGVSSFQLDNVERGFSYNEDNKLDMRMDQTQDFTAHELVNTYTKSELTRVIREYGEEKWASRIADFIEEKRQDKPIDTTFELVGIIKAAIPASARRKGGHPAKRTFQAIRIETNGELRGLGKSIEDMVDVLNVRGRAAIITFHSLEDRIVKRTFAKLEKDCICDPKAPICTCDKRAEIKLLTRKPITATENELHENPRAKSAKLRSAEKTET